jgi:two-component sensor histidine kinase
MRDHAPPHPATTCAAFVSASRSRTFSASPDQVSQARRFLARHLASFLAADDALLCVSELVSNAIVHSRSARPGGRFTVRATLTSAGLRVEVEDDGGPWQQQPDPGGQHGRGLVIVAALARWGITGDGSGPRTVWFQIPC